MMKTGRFETGKATLAEAISAWENEGGRTGREPSGGHYGRRIEADRSWTVYHVFTGVPAQVGDNAMTGMSRRDATSRMLSLNLHSVEHRDQRLSLSGPGANTSVVCGS